MSLSDQIIQPAAVLGQGSSGSGGGASPPFAISDTTGLQAALDSKLEDFSDLGAADMPTGIDASKLADGSVSNAELQYIGTLTSNAQTQLNNKLGRAVPVTGGTNTAYTLTDASIGTPADGDIFACRVHTANGASPTLAINGGTAYPMVYLAPGNTFTALAASSVSTVSALLLRWDQTNLRFIVLAGASLVAGQIPTTLNGTTFNGNCGISGGLTMSGGTGVIFSGNSTIASNGGNSVCSMGKDSSSNLFYNIASVGAYNFYINGALRAALDGANLTTAGNLGVTGGQIWPNGNTAGLMLLGGNTNQGAAGIVLYNIGGTNAGTLRSSSPLTTRSNSTTVQFESVGSSDFCRFMIIDDQGKVAWGFCTGAGVVTIDAASHADYVATASPTSGQIGIHWLSNALRMTVGSAAVRKTSQFTWVAKG